jgi:hypothetical protein
MTQENSLVALILAAVVAVIGIGIVVAIVEDDEPSQVEAEEQLCDDIGTFVAALGAIQDTDSDTSIEEFEELRDNVRTAYDNMLASAQAVRYSRINELEDAFADLRSAIEDIDTDQSLQEARDSIEEEVEQASIEIAQIMNDVDCGSGQGGQERSDE